MLHYLLKAVVFLFRFQFVREEANDYIQGEANIADKKNYDFCIVVPGECTQVGRKDYCDS